MPRLAIFNQKGGVGKTTTTLNLAAAIHRHGSAEKREPLLLDLDPQGHLSSIQGNPPREVGKSLFSFYQEGKSLSALEMPWQGLGTLVPSHQQLIKVDSIFGKGPTVLNKLRNGLDALESESRTRITLIDSCPYLGVLSLNAIFAADWILIPVSTDFLSLQAATQMTRTLEILKPVMKRRIERRYVLTRFDRRRRMSLEIQARITKLYGTEVCKTVIAESVAIAESPSLNCDVFTHAEKSPGARDYLALFKELESQGVFN
jgi:chromosome partitioning protein